MTSNREIATTIAGSLYLLGIVAGILSIAYAVDDPDYLVKASSNVSAVLTAAFFHFLMAPMYLGIAIALFPVLYKANQWLAFGFAAFRIAASVFIMVGTILLLLLLSLSQEFVTIGTSTPPYYQTIGGLLQTGRDLTNHVATILSVSFGGLLLNILLFKAKLVPRWLSGWGLIGTLLAIIASYLVMFRLLSIISEPYIILNLPMAFQEIVFGVWLIVKGFRKTEVPVSY